jgi:hypothetical protein
MNNCPGRGDGPRPPWPRRVRAAAVITAMAAALLAAACGSPSSTGSGGSPNAGGSANSPVPVAYSRCMRSHGIPNFPDPNSSGQIPKQEILQLGVSTSALQTAQRACIRLWPYQAPTRAQQRQQLADDLKFAQCMRSHGLPDFPDPTTGPDGRVEFVLSVSRDGFDPRSPQILAKAHECQYVLPAGTGLPSATEAP